MKITTEIPISRKFKNKYLSKITNDFKNNLFLNSLIKTYETKLEDEQDSSLSALGDYTKIINVMLEDLNKISTNKIDLGFSYEEMKQNLIAILWNASDYTKPELRNIKDKSEKLIKTFDIIQVEPDVLSFVKKNEKEYNIKMTEVCNKVLINKDDYIISMDKLYKEINNREEQIKSHFKNLNSKLSLKKELEYEACIKLKETALQKIERDSARRGNPKDCFEKLKDLIRCRCTISTLDEMKRIFDYLENEHDILQVKNALDRENVPTVYIVYKMLDESVLPPVEFQILYKERNHHIHDFYDLARLESDKEFETWAIYNISKLFPNEYIEITKKADIEKKRKEELIKREQDTREKLENAKKLEIETKKMEQEAKKREKNLADAQKKLANAQKMELEARKQEIEANERMQKAMQEKEEANKRADEAKKMEEKVRKQKAEADQLGKVVKQRTDEYDALNIQDGKEYRLVNKKFKGPLFCGDGKDMQGDHSGYVVPEEKWDKEGKARWIFKCVNKEFREFKLFNKKNKGPLFCGDGTDFDGDHSAYICPNVKFEKQGKELWIISKVGNGEYKLINKKWQGPLFCGDRKNWSGDHAVFVETDVKYEKGGKERWFIRPV